MLATLFAATEAELDALFPEWMVPRAEPETRTGTNPFDGEPMTWLSWLPDGEPRGMSGLDPAPRPGAPAVAGLAVEGYPVEAADTDEVPAPLRTVPHTALRDVNGLHLDAVSTALGVAPSGRPARVAPDGTQLDALDPAAVAALLRLEAGAARSLAAAVAASDAFGGDDALARRLVASLQALARAAPTASRHCVHCTP
jgi:hypothetical protein